MAPDIPRIRPRRARAGALLLVGAMTVTGCYQNPDPTEWGPAAKANFVLGCTTEVTAKGGTTTSVAIQTKAVCECIYELIKKPEVGEAGKYAIEWSAMKEYEQKQADAKPGDLPTPPEQLTKAIDDCEVAGP